MLTHLTRPARTLLFLAGSLSAFAQSAPYSVLYYNDSDSGDIIMTRLRVAATTHYTYFAAMSWNNGVEGLGYCGIQDAGPAGRNFIFSLWDPTKGGGTPVAIYSNPHGTVSRFGGEGTGIHYLNYAIPWSRNRWYRFVARTWDDHGHTYFALWSQDETARSWIHHATFDFPVASIRFAGFTASFLEDWEGTGGKTRRVELNDGWKRTAAGKWAPFDSASFSMTRSSGQNGPYLNAFDAGVAHSAYYMQTGGRTTPTIGATASFPLAATGAPVLTAGRIHSAVARYDGSTQQLTVSWGSDEHYSPQFSYRVEVFDGISPSASPRQVQAAIAPHIRSVALAVPNLSTGGSYCVRLTTTDIFDQPSAPLVVPVVFPRAAAPRAMLTAAPPRVAVSAW